MVKNAAALDDDPKGENRMNWLTKANAALDRLTHFHQFAVYGVKF